jgi:outer membrane protein OmpA-like peptidoglycan-associated protein
MKLQFALISILALALAAARAQDHASSFDAEAAKAKLAPPVAKMPGKFLTKGIGGDPETKRYYTKDAIVVTRSSGATEQHPYVAVSLLFQKNSDELLDTVSRENVAKVAKMLKEIGAGGFAIEGHASAEGDADLNIKLSKLRALKIQTLLREAGVPETELGRIDGFGAKFANAAATAPEKQLQQDRRVLVVKER